MEPSSHTLVARKYIMESKLGNGKFGQVYKGVRKRTNELVAIKTESIETPIKLLKQETTLLNYMAGRCIDVIPEVYWYGIHNNATTLVMPFYEITLDDYYKTNQNTTELLQHMSKMMEIVEHVHECGVIHRDIKPSNFMMKGDKIVLIDFGLASIYVDESGKHIPEKPCSAYIMGTPKFISVHIHNGVDASRRDDIISLCYIYFYLANNCILPWEHEQQEHPQTNTAETNANPLHIQYSKNLFRKRLKVLHFHDIKNGDYPILDKSLLTYSYQMKIHEKPHYRRLISLFHSQQHL